MKRILLSLLLLGSVLLAEVSNIEVSREFVESNSVKIIDIRTESEWKEKGVIKNAHLITFFDEEKNYSTKLFLKEINKIIDKNEYFAIISNTASRTMLVSNFLGNKHHYHVINLIGGMEKLVEEGYEVKPYKPQHKTEEKLAFLDEKRIKLKVENNTTKE